ncbi:hypothetical protein PILCRDRAFT_826148 [Piloderma croceum F 1598]|uniref:Uncharacterized protein n=1 Tax=Piloderma croceum (strain F 1598) TaxID=765440 RepID=A0A0C3FA29_PILCF|nr:hypothetical protein PILCRDRAFT_826148 [Piloderma croceum F 1598]
MQNWKIWQRDARDVILNSQTRVVHDIAKDQIPGSAPLNSRQLVPLTEGVVTSGSLLNVTGEEISESACERWTATLLRN